MPQGLQCFDDNGNSVLDVTDRLTRVIGELETGVSDGSVYNESLTYGIPWFIVINDSAPWYTKASVQVSVANGTLSWSLSTTGQRSNNKIIYGVY